MTVQSSLLAKVRVGDVIPATGYSHHSAICLVTAVYKDGIDARTVTTQVQLLFDQIDGRSGTCVIDTVASGPDDVYTALMDIDLKFRLGDRSEGYRLLEHERNALLFAAKFDPSYPPRPLGSEREATEP